MVCPKCGHRRQQNAAVPAWQCPACGVAYDKVNAAPVAKPARPAKRAFSFKKLRIAVLLLLLAGVALDSQLTLMRSTAWDRPLWAVLYPIAADDSAEVAAYIPALANEDFTAIEEYFVAQSQRYGLMLKEPVALRLGPVIDELPPLPPAGGSVLEVMWWSLKLRYWSLVMDSYTGPRPDIRIFVLYHRFEESKRLPHSTGLQKGMVSVVHAFADERLAGRNQVVIAHEMLHTVGATDKYELNSGRPLFPEGYAEPEREPRLPQRFAEIMGAYIPQSATESVMPADLAQTLVGNQTAAQIGWLKGE